MKKYLFGLGAMLVGAGLMFILMHGEVSAEIGKVYDKPEPFVCSDYGDSMDDGRFEKGVLHVFHCRVGNLTCGVAGQGISCVKTKSGLFK